MRSSKQDPVVILGTARTPLGCFVGEPAALAAPELGARAIEAAVGGGEATAVALERTT